MIDPRGIRRGMAAVRSALRGFRATPLVFAISVVSMTAGLLVLGVYLLVLQNMRSMLDSFGDGLQVAAYLDSELPLEASRIAEVERRIGALPGVASVRFVSPEAGLVRLRADLGDQADVLDGLSRNPLPATIELEPRPSHRTPEAVEPLAAALAALPEVAEVRYRRDWVESFARVVGAAEWVGLVLGVVLTAVLAVVSSGTIRLAVYTRADEIQIQRLVGAGAGFVRLPFYLEGALQGALAAGLALGLLFGLYRIGLPLLREPLAFLLGAGSVSFLGSLEASLLAGLGVTIGIGGAALSLLRLEKSL